MTGLPILSVMTWAPFIAALIVMAFARHRPLLVRWTSLIGATVSLVASMPYTIIDALDAPVDVRARMQATVAKRLMTMLGGQHRDVRAAGTADVSAKAVEDSGGAKAGEEFALVAWLAAADDDGDGDGSPNAAPTRGKQRMSGGWVDGLFRRDAVGCWAARGHFIGVCRQMTRRGAA